VAHVIETLGAGGAEMLLAEVTARLNPRRFRSRVFPLDGPLDLRPRFDRAGIEVDPLGIAPARRPVACLATLTARLKHFRPRIVHTHLYYANVLGRLAGWLGPHALLVSTLHNPDYTFEGKGGLLFAGKKALDRFTGRHNAALLAVSRAVADDFERHLGWGGIRIVPSGVDVEHYCPGVASPAGVWRGAGLRLLHVGRLHTQKGQRFLIDAVDLLRRQGCQSSLVIAGEGPLREELEDRVRRLGLDGCVSLLGRRDDVRDLLRAADVFVFPSLYEAAGIALLEAMACARPVVASRTGGIVEIVRDGVDGLLVPPGDSEALANALGRLAADPALRGRLTAAARTRAIEFDIHRTVEAVEAIYEEIVFASTAAPVGGATGRASA
jgi:glycosyltransferase involved in cell wall biosynthesis